MTEAPDQGGRGPVLQAAADLPIDPDSIEQQTTFGPMFTRGDVPQEEPEEEDEDSQVLSDIDPKVREDFTGLTRLGYLEDTCTIAGHEFRLRTPSHDERIERGSLHKQYLGSMNTEPMWALLTVAAYCVEIDGVPAPEPLNTKTSGVADRLRWVKDTVYSQVMIEKIFRQCLMLDAREFAVVEYLDSQGKA